MSVSTHHSEAIELDTVGDCGERAMTATLQRDELHTTTDCRACGASGSFRPRGVTGQFFLKMCSACRYYRHWPLPTITKKIIYLDQLALSGMVKVKEPFWPALQAKLGSLVYLQLVVCPTSEIHEDESLLDFARRSELKDMYRSFAGHDRFRLRHEVEQRQLLRSIRRYLRVANGKPQDSGWVDAFERDPHLWSTGLRVYADMPVHEPWVTDIRDRKKALHSDLESVAAFWKEEDKQFLDDVRRESKDYGRSLVTMYRQRQAERQNLTDSVSDELKPIMRAFMGADFDPAIPPDMRPGILLVHSLAAEVRKARPDEADPIGVVEQFFASTDAMETPFLYISSRLWASIAQRVRNPKGSRTPKPSDSYDVNAISTFAPYCDAMFVDNEFRAMASQKCVGVCARYGTKFFSAKTRDEFFAYLDGVLAEMSDAHREGLALAHPHLIPVLPFIGRKAKPS